MKGGPSPAAEFPGPNGVLTPSEIGEIATMARRNGSRWFVCIANGAQPRKFAVPLSFLADGATYTASTVSDVADNATAVDVKSGQKLRRGDTLMIDCSAGGGFVARFVKDE